MVSAALAAFDGWFGGLLPGWELLLQGLNILISFAILTLLFANDFQAHALDCFAMLFARSRDNTLRLVRIFISFAQIQVLDGGRNRARKIAVNRQIDATFANRPTVTIMAARSANS